MYRPDQTEPSQLPEWRLPPRRPIPSQNAPPPPPPQPPTGSGYTPGAFGPMSPTPGVSTILPSPVSPMAAQSSDPRTWGVQYNKHQIYAPPPLPPRPSSTNEQPYSYAQSQQHQQQQYPQPQPQPQPQSPVLTTNILPGAPTPGSEAFAEAQPGSATSIPPPYDFPPRPSQPQNQQYQDTNVPPPPPKIPRDQDSAPSQVYQPSQPPVHAQGISPAATHGSHGFQQNASLNPNSTVTFSSALGPGTPSDWEHLGPTEGDFDDAPWFPPRDPPPPTPPQPSQSVQTPPGFSTGISNSATSPVSANPVSQENFRQEHLGAIYRTSTPQRTDSISPISPSTTYSVPTLPPPNRVDSAGSNDSWSRRADSIENVIDAWVKPLEPGPKPTQPEPDSVTLASRSDFSSHRNSIETTTPVLSPSQDTRPRSTTGTPTETKGSVAVAPQMRNPDPYEDLDPWFKSSLTRYIAMLRKEAVADSDEERYKIFTAFMAKETKLREILYNIEHEPVIAKEEPRLSTVTQDPIPLSPKELEEPKEPEKPKIPIESGLIPVETEEERGPSPATISTGVPDSNDGEDAGSEYSAGGRPILGKQARRGSTPWQPNLTMSLSEEKPPLEPLMTNPPRPIYTPFQYTEGPQRGSDDLKFDRPAHQAYSDLRQASAISGRVMSNYGPLTSGLPRIAPLNPSTPALNEHDETFVGLIRHKSNAYQLRGGRSETPLSSLPESLRQGPQARLVEELRAMVWTPLDKQTESSWHITTREDLEKYSEDFSYIQNTIDEWERAEAVRRHRLDEDRAARQENSESQIDALFDGKEIGYADINTLEEDFRQTEARAQLDEEREEVEKFTTEVFNPLDERLKNEISALRKSYDSALGQLDRDQKSKNNSSDRRSPSVTMKMVNEIHNRLEIRFQKRLELALDSERRRKRAERRPLVFMGDMASLRTLDGDFDRMEKRNVLEAAKDTDERANRLMDSFDDAILHGLGMNQSLLDELSSKLSRLDYATIRASGLTDSELEQILKSAAKFASSLRMDSETILRCSGVAERALNDADYSISVAEAKYADSEPDIFERLESEKKKEDLTLQADLDSKLQSIQKAPQDLDNIIERLTEGLGKAPKFAVPASPITDEMSPVSQSPDVQALKPPPLELRPATVVPSQSQTPAPSTKTSELGTEHQERLRRALEEAKKRNAARANE
ncbi:hypothetical protein N7478_001117 [Penicillium angulare]|uniref:uncharacterized protein n=1 Tax=Penicillium angulare TaxID=116970 RepID=UPI00253FED6B|nr:uncharacterized protein N7478_001117 [Penicillium angulare]KAJ5291866.1 hypothetical protein N7478_001117 [Penicillium angulare]